MSRQHEASMPDECTYPFRHIQGHYFLDLNQGSWLVDTGAPITFGTTRALEICGEHFHFNNTYLSLTTEALSGFIGTPCDGLLGMDLLRVHDMLFDPARGSAVFSRQKMLLAGTEIACEEFMGIPILPVEVRSRTYRMFLDTGAQLSYFQSDAIQGFEDAGEMEDFFPEMGRFTTRTYQVEMRVGGQSCCLRSGRLPGRLGLSLQLANVQGIVGNQVFEQVRQLGFSPRLQRVCFSCR